MVNQNNAENTDLGRKLQGHQATVHLSPASCSPPSHPALACMPAETESSQPAHLTGRRGNHPSFRTAETSSSQSLTHWPTFASASAQEESLPLLPKHVRPWAPLLQANVLFPTADVVKGSPHTGFSPQMCFARSTEFS